MFAGALAAVVALAPSATFAQGGGDAKDGRSSSSHSRQWNAKTANNTQSSDGRHGHGGNYNDQRWWGNFSAENFQKIHEAKLAKLDKTIADNNLTVENATTLRAAVVADAEDVKTQLTAFKQLHDSIDKDNATDEQKASLKAQALVTFESYYDYSESLHEFKAAIKAAANTESKGVEIESDTEQ